MSKAEWGVVANVVSDRVLRTGARVWLLRCNGDAENPVVRGCSKGGRVITKYMKYKRLANFRAAFIPPDIRDEVSDAWYACETKEEAQAVAAGLQRMWGDVRFMRPDGTPGREGISTGEAFRRAAHLAKESEKESAAS